MISMKKMNVQAMCTRIRHKKLSLFIFSLDYCELPKRTIRANGNIYHIFKANNFRDLQKIYQEKASLDMTPNEFKFLTSTFWKEKYQPLTLDMTKDN